MGLRDFVQKGMTSPEQASSAQPDPVVGSEEITDDQILKLAGEYFPQLPPDQVFQIIQQIKDSVDEELSPSDVIGLIYKYINKRQEGTSRFQDLKGKLEG